MKTENWKFALFLLCLLTTCVRAAEPAATAWIVNTANQNTALARIRPEVHSVDTTDRHVEIRSSGTSLYFFGPLQTPADHVERIRQLQFRIPRDPKPAGRAHSSVRPDVVGVFVNGIPIYNRFESASYQGRNLWHFDLIAGGDDGARVAGGRPRAEPSHGASLGLLELLIADASRHSPIIGFAFDGYPIYGPWGFVNADGTGGLRRMRSGYRPRPIKRRATWPDGTELSAGQHGPEVNAEFPLGTFVEDYEFVAGAGDLDQFNGRFARTPEYPEGTYAYFLSTDAEGRLAFPYLLSNRYYGAVSSEELREAVRDSGAGEASPINLDGGGKAIFPSSPGKPILELRVGASAPSAGRPIRLSFQAGDAKGAPIRFLEYVHERPLHLLIVSDDLAEFDHVHPELVVGDRYEIAHTFRHAGRYRLYADFTPPGRVQRVETFELTIGGTARAPIALAADASWTKARCGLELRLAANQTLRAGEEIEFALSIRDAATQQPVADLEPYLGAWAHFVLIDRTKQHFIHAHPLDARDATPNSPIHLHGVSELTAGPPPNEIRFLTSFPQPGLYKLWAQFQRDGEVVVQPFVLSVGPAALKRQTVATIPSDAIRVKVGPSGFEIEQRSIVANRPVKLAITRDSQPNCGSEIVFPSLGLRRKLPLGETVLIELPALPAGELRFTCGMGMYKGMIVVQ
ncbi:MAG: YHYH protein [Blastocatellia bacterium]